MKVIAFDVNETLLDLRALDPLFERAFGDASLRAQWFAQMLQLAFVGTITGRYVDFTSAQRAALSMLAEKTGIELADADAEEIVGAMATLPPHPEVHAALERLRDAGLRLVTLTNSTADVGRAQIENAGLADLFEQTLSADEIGTLKPAREAYELAGTRTGVELGEIRLVAAHAWDVAGALAAGCAAAFVERPGMVLSPIGEAPDISGADLSEVAERILASDAG